LGERRNHQRVRLLERISPVLLRTEPKSRSRQLVALRIVCAKLLARAHWPVVPVVDAIAIEIRLANLRTVLASVRSCVRVCIQALAADAGEHSIPPLAPIRVDAPQRPVDRVTKLVNRDALIV